MVQVGDQDHLEGALVEAPDLAVEAAAPDLAHEVDRAAGKVVRRVGPVRKATWAVITGRK